MKYTWKLSTEQKREITQFYIAGESSYKLAKRYAVSDCAILGLLRRRRIKRRDIQETRFRYPINKMSFQTPSQEVSYWIGFITADGSLTGNQFSMTISAKDKTHLFKLKNFLKSDHPIKEKMVGVYPQVRFDFRCPEIANDLRKYGIISKAKRIVSTRFTMDRHFWRGMIDGDGYIGLSKERWPRARLQLVGNPHCMGVFAEFLSNKLHKEISIRPHKNIYSVQLSGRLARSIMKLLYSNCTIALDRKFSLVNSILSMPEPRVYNSIKSQTA